MNFELTKLLAPQEKVILDGFLGASFAQFLAKAHHETRRPVLVICEDIKKAEALKEEIAFFSSKSRIEILPSFDVKPYYGLSPHLDTVLQTQKILHLLLTDQIDFLIAPKMAVLRRLTDKDFFSSLSFSLQKNDLIDREEFLKKIANMGYSRSPVVEDSGQFAVRGDLIDIFCPHNELPYRLSFFDIEIEDIKTFDPTSQRSKGSINQIEIIPVKEVLLNYFSRITHDAPRTTRQNWKSELKVRADARDIAKFKRDQVEEFVLNGIYFHGIEFFLPLFYHKLDSIFDYLSVRTLIVSDLSSNLKVEADQCLQSVEEDQKKSDHIETIIAPQEIYLTGEEIQNHLQRFTQIQQNVLLSSERDATTLIQGETESNLLLKTKIAAQVAHIHNLAPLASELNQKRLDGITCYIVCSTSLQLERMKDLLARFELPLKVIAEDLQDEVIGQSLRPNEPERLILLLTGQIHEGFFSPKSRQWWITDEEIFGKKTRRAVSKSQQTTVFSSFSELTDGDYIIHMDHGIGIYKGLVKLDFDVNQNDFLLIEYLSQDKLYVPIDKLNRVQRFVAEEGSSPQLDKLGGTTWIKTRNKAKKAVQKLAVELLQLQAKRESLVGYAFNPHTEAVEEFEAGFEFEETPDQMRAIEDVYKDLTRERPMDRLVCGDVGYGKTEVAMRGVFLAVLDQKQVAVLVPTTILAFQHYQTFKKRFANYPVNVELLSRFRSPKEQTEVVQKLKDGSVDVVVGTHRLISQDIKFRDLGLLVIDEEHRFGVTHKEKIKKLKNLVDVVTLTATPIPRTLNFALNGIRDLSIINTPPVDRLAIRTYTCYFDEVTIRDAIMKEMQRGGQVYFVHNRVQSIEKITAQIAKLIPEAKVKFAHGQMEEGQLEDIMIAFINHEFDVLVCTTIVESGIDIPNANTMIINRADTFGLAQLYQLRGRIGRSHHRAFCYLIIPSETLLTDKAKKRLAVIQRFTELGSGFKIASHDLEIRGAGNILGDEQSGHIAAVGYDLYAQMLEAAIREIKNEKMPQDFEPEIQLNVTTKIPEDFVADTQLRLTLYKQISSAESLDDVDQTAEEWQDRFGKLPEDVLHLVELIKIRILCKQNLVSTMKQKGEMIVFGFHPDHEIDTQVLMEAIKKNPKKFGITRDGLFSVTEKFASARELLKYIRELLEKLSQTKI